MCCYPVRIQSIEGGREFVHREIRALGPMKRGEWITFIVFMLTSTLWITRPWLKQLSIGSGDDALHPFAGLTDAGIAMIAAMLLFVLPVNWRERTFTMNWQHARRLPWGILILFGGGLSLAGAIEANGVAEFIGSQTHQFAGLPPIVLVIIVVTAVVFFSEIASNTATATTLIPILAAMRAGLGVHPYMLVIPAAIAASMAFMMPVGTPPNAIVFSTGYITMPQMIKAGFWLNIVGILIITLVTYAIVQPTFCALSALASNDLFRALESGMLTRLLTLIALLAFTLFVQPAFAQPPHAPAQPPASQPQQQQLHWGSKLGWRSLQVTQAARVVDRVVLVPDAATYVDEIRKWSTRPDGGRWRVLIEDDVFAPMFVRRFNPAELIRREKVATPLPDDPCAAPPRARIHRRRRDRRRPQSSTASINSLPSPTTPRPAWSLRPPAIPRGQPPRARRRPRAAADLDR